MRSRFSTSSIVVNDTFPSRRPNLLIDIERTSSHLIKLGTLNPPSGGKTGTCERMPFPFNVMGSTTTNLEWP